MPNSKAGVRREAIGKRRVARRVLLATMLAAAVVISRTQAYPDQANQVVRVNHAVAAALDAAETREQGAAAHIEPLPMRPGEVGDLKQREHGRLGSMIRGLGISADGST